MRSPNASFIQYRPQQAEETLSEAQVLLRESLFRGVVNRAYYAMFYAVLALAASQNQTGSKHSGMITFFDRDFVKTGIFHQRYSKMLHLAFERRQGSDYGELFLIDQPEAEQALAEAREFVGQVKVILQNLMSSSGE